MKKSLVLGLVFMLLLGSVTPSLAAGRPGGTFTLAGNITAINGSTVTVHVVGDSPAVKAFIGADLPLQTTGATRFLLNTDTATVPITLADLQVGQSVSASGKIANGIWTALRITVGATLIHYP